MSMVETVAAEPPTGMRLNNVGGYTPESMIKPHVLLEDALVRELLHEAEMRSRELAAFRVGAFADVDAFLELIAEKYDAPKGGAKGNVTLESFDGLRRIQVATGDFLTFGPELQAAKSLVDNCLTRWTDSAGDEIKAIVNDAFDVGKEGKIRVDRVLSLRRLKIEDPVWCRAMTAIGDAVRVTHSKRYVRFYTRPKQDAEWRQVSLDLSRAVAP